MESGATPKLLTFRAHILIAIAFVHIALILVTSSTDGLWVRNARDLPGTVSLFIILFIGYAVYVLGKRARYRGSYSVKTILIDAVYLGLLPAFLLCLVLSGFLMTSKGIPYSGVSRINDELIIWFVSWALMSSIGYVSSESEPTPSADRTRISTSNGQLPDTVADQTYTAAVLHGVGKERQVVIRQLVQRAMQLQKRSGIILIGIVFMLVCAAIFIVFAGQITSLDVSGVKLVSLALSDVRAAEDDLQQINTEIRARTENLRRAKEQAAKIETAAEPAVKATFDDSSDEFLKLKFEAKKTALLDANATLLKVRQKQYEDDRPKDQTSGQTLLIQTSVTRFGVVIIMVFLVQILVNLYRYNMRLSAFYFGRSDALVLLNKGSDDLNLGTLVELISPDKLDFGKAPRTPAQEAAELIQSWNGRLKTGEDSRPDGQGAHANNTKAGKPRAG
jgi:hypothetical protein